MKDGFDLTYEELKLFNDLLTDFGEVSFDLTYEELKPFVPRNTTEYPVGF